MIGANFGDEGKGALVDHLCSRSAPDAVVRFNGGAQAGHTVVEPSGRRHVFKHLGSGTLLGVPTFLAQRFITNPILLAMEVNDLLKLKPDVNPILYAHHACLVTTFVDMGVNQRDERERARARHGSCGVGLNETVNRSEVPRLALTVGDLHSRSERWLRDTVEQICTSWATFRTGKAWERYEPQLDLFLKTCRLFASTVRVGTIRQFKDVLFEGAQGLLLDQNNKEYFPHLTRSNTGMRNVRELMAEAKLDACETWYVSRTYLTRHGAGPLPFEDPKLRYADDTNVTNEWQGALRFAPLAPGPLVERCVTDYGSDRFKLAMTHCDQWPSIVDADLYATGPTRADWQAKLPELWWDSMGTSLEERP